MATATYTPIATQTLASAASSITFSSIPSTYTDLRVVLVALGSSAIYGPKITFNSDTGTNYSERYIAGDGSSAISSSVQNNNNLTAYRVTLDTSMPSFVSMDIFQYANTGVYKTALYTVSQDMNGSGATSSKVGLWRSTSAISTITMTTSSSTFATGTTATIYGILKA